MIYKRGKFWWYEFRVAKIRYRGSTESKKKRNAQEFHDDLKELKKRESLGLEVPIKNHNIPTAIAKKITKKKATKKTIKRKASEPMNVAKDNIFKMARIPTRMNQEQSAKKLGIHATTLSKYENGSRYPSGKLLGKMSQIYDVDINSLVHSSKPAGHQDVESLKEENQKLKDELKKLKDELLECYRQIQS